MVYPLQGIKRIYLLTYLLTYLASRGHTEQILWRVCQLFNVNAIDRPSELTRTVWTVSNLVGMQAGWKTVVLDQSSPSNATHWQRDAKSYVGAASIKHVQRSEADIDRPCSLHSTTLGETRALQHDARLSTRRLLIPATYASPCHTFHYSSPSTFAHSVQVISAGSTKLSTLRQSDLDQLRQRQTRAISRDTEQKTNGKNFKNRST